MKWLITVDECIYTVYGVPHHQMFEIESHEKIGDVRRCMECDAMESGASNDIK